jgi:putative MFS transporter
MAVGALSIEDAIDRIGFGRFQKRLLAVCGITWAADAAEVLLLGFALPAIIAEWKLSPAGAGLIVTSTFIGMLAGAWFWGTISDRIGRRTGFQLTVLIFAVFGILSAFAPNPVALMVLRALTGFGLGGALPLDFSLYAEYLPRANRGRNLVLLESFWALGTILAAGLAWAIVPALGWRPLLATSALAAVLVLWIRRTIPESPRYLAISGRLEEAKAVLAQVSEANQREVPLGELQAPTREDKSTVAALWSPGIRRVTLMLWIAWFSIALAYYGVFTWLPSLFVERGFTFLATYQNTFVLALAQLPGYFSAAYLVERWGRRATLTTYLLASGVFTYLFAVTTGLGWILGAAILMSFFSLGAWAALYAYTPELYPTEIRTTGMGWASGMARIAGALSPTVGGLLIGVALTGALSLWALAFVAGSLAVGTLGVETADRPLADTIGPPERQAGAARSLSSRHVGG